MLYFETALLRAVGLVDDPIPQKESGKQTRTQANDVSEPYAPQRCGNLSRTSVLRRRCMRGKMGFGLTSSKSKVEAKFDSVVSEERVEGL